MTGDGEADVDLDSILAAARQRSLGHRGGRSPVYDLMWDHHARLVPELNPPRRPNWCAVAEVLGRQGLLDGAGQALTAASACAPYEGTAPPTAINAARRTSASVF